MDQKIVCRKGRCVDEASEDYKLDSVAGKDVSANIEKDILKSLIR